jgi:hypothetical protein
MLDPQQNILLMRYSVVNVLLEPFVQLALHFLLIAHQEQIVLKSVSQAVPNVACAQKDIIVHLQLQYFWMKAIYVHQDTSVQAELQIQHLTPAYCAHLVVCARWDHLFLYSVILEHINLRTEALIAIHVRLDTIVP